MGASEKREFISRLAQLLMHLLKWNFQPALRSKSWQITLREQRRAVSRLIKENPSKSLEQAKIPISAASDRALRNFYCVPLCSSLEKSYPSRAQAPEIYAKRIAS